MVMRLLKQPGEWAISLWNKYSSDIFFRTTCHIIFLQVILTAIILTGLWFVLSYLVSETSQILIDSFGQMLQGQRVSAGNMGENLERVRLDQFWTVMVITSAVILSFGFIMVYVSLTPTRRSLDRKKRFISNISHELRTPLAVMRTNTDLLLRDSNISTETRDLLKQNITEFERVSEIMNNLLSLSNVMQDQQLAFEKVDLSVVAQRAIDGLAHTVDHKDISLVLQTHTHQAVLGNASALEQVVFNLIKNAIAHIRARGTVTVTIETAFDGKHVNVSVSDTGSGISRDDLFHIFDPFFRSRSSIKSHNGQGLGLAIVNEIVQMHRGKIRVNSARGRGTTVTVSIRRCKEEYGTDASEEANDGEEISMDFSRRILL